VVVAVLVTLLVLVVLVVVAPVLHSTAMERLGPQIRVAAVAVAAGLVALAWAGAVVLA
jgi:hypothetical protein